MGAGYGWFMPRCIESNGQRYVRTVVFGRKIIFSRSLLGTFNNLKTMHGLIIHHCYDDDLKSMERSL